MYPSLKRPIKILVLVLLDVASFFAALAASVLLTPACFRDRLVFMLIAFGVTAVSFVVGQLYRLPVFTAGFAELVRITCSVMGMSVILIIVQAVFSITTWIELWLFLLFFFYFVLFCRFSGRVWRSLRYRHEAYKKYVRVMIVGGGDAGTSVIREMKTSKKTHYLPVCVIDDDKNKWYQRIMDVPVVGDRTRMAEMAVKYNVAEIYITIPSATPAAIQDICGICARIGLPVRILPGVYEMLTGKPVLGQLRDVDVSDLLGRAQVKTDYDAVCGYIRGRRVLVTGGGGSIGSELCRQIAAHDPARLVIFDIYENNAYDIQMELRHHYPALDLQVLIGSVRDEKRVREVFEAERPELVFHAAAHKHVPLMEGSPNEAVKNNVFGTYNVARAAGDFGTARFVMISTDKAVNPTNVMGATKRICEMIIQYLSRHTKGTEYVAVRFGNVLGSNGSVIPLFKKQISAGGPVTVTHPDIIRYFMTIPEAAALVLQAGAYAKGGEIFVLDMGKPVKILDLAENLIRLSGFKPYEDIQIEFTGLRPGEKLYEELLMDEEGLQSTANQKIHIGRPLSFDEAEFLSVLEQLRTQMDDDKNDLKPLIKRLVPTFRQEPPPPVADKTHEQDPS